MQESDTYMMILEEGEAKAMREAMVIVGEPRFGPASSEVRSRLCTLSDRDHLKRLLRNSVSGTSWQEILETP
jgi:hypothetical protein